MTRRFKIDDPEILALGTLLGFKPDASTINAMDAAADAGALDACQTYGDYARAWLQWQVTATERALERMLCMLAKAAVEAEATSETPCIPAMRRALDLCAPFVMPSDRRTALAAQYIAAIGYNPFEDDPTISEDEVEKTLREHAREERRMAERQP